MSPIVITGIGWVTPLGHEVESVWRRLLAGETGVAPITRFDASTFPTTFAAQVRDYDHTPFVRYGEVHEGVGLNTAFALGAARQAWRVGGAGRAISEGADLDPERLGLYLGSGEGSIDFDNTVAANLAAWSDEDRAVDAQRAGHGRRGGWLDPRREIEQEPNMPLTHLAMEFDAMGPAYNCLTACAASTQAIGEAGEILRRGDADVMITGGAHTMIHPFGVTGFNRLTALSNRNDDPLHAARPFSADRDGFVMGEGAGMLILETLDHAQPSRRHAPGRGCGLRLDGRRVSHHRHPPRGQRRRRRHASGPRRRGLPTPPTSTTSPPTARAPRRTTRSRRVRSARCLDAERDCM